MARNFIEPEYTPEVQAVETEEWRESLDYVLQQGGPERVIALFEDLKKHAARLGVKEPFTANTPYVNTIPPYDEPRYPGNRALERRIKSLIRWNAMAMVVRANKLSPGIGGHISSYASAATLYEVGFNHFFRGRTADFEGDMIFFQGHSAPGFYARAFLEGRLSHRDLENFRRELEPEGGLSSYPHPWLMPEFWQVPTVSMGLGPIMAIYQARFLRYLEDRGLKAAKGAKVWAFLGDGETDEPETLGAISLAAREKLDNLIFVINCNLQRLDGPVRGNGQIIQELERNFRGTGWNAIKVVWGGDFDPLLESKYGALLTQRMGEVVDGEYQKYIVEGGAYLREHFYGKYPELLELVKNISDDDLAKLRLGGHDPQKVYAAYYHAFNHKGAPSVILARTVKGYGLGEAGEGKNITHQQKKLNEAELVQFRSRFDIPLSEEEVTHAPFFRPPEESPEIQYIHERRRSLGSYLPRRVAHVEPLATPGEELFQEFYEGTDGREVSTTMAFVRILTKLLRDKNLGKYVVPIVPDEARTFGMEALFRQVGIYASTGQLYEPVDSDSLLYYKEDKTGQILEEGITEAGSMASFIAAGTAYANFDIPTLPFFIYYSMFGFQRFGDLAWAAADMRARGFLVGGTAGRTTLAGEGLQHQDGHSHLLATAIPTVQAYDPAFAYELAVIIQDGMHRMMVEHEDIYYYLTVGNENYAMLPMPAGAGVREGILRGLYRVRPSDRPDAPLRAQLLGSGSILNEALKAQGMLAERYGVAADVWSVTSYKELRRDGLETERWNLLNPGQPPRVPFFTTALQDAPGAIVAASDYVKAMPDSIARWAPRPLISLGTDGFGRSESRDRLRDFFEVDARYITLATLTSLARTGELPTATVQQAMSDLEINPNKPNPLRA
ncbi:MAG TPA: pyruvate dehydrogenase (acetyl-transferring), homodimeric type [Anaerolineae bacterium]|nr:pyruvate dehydrogenase (acetyl-transferring), homodimeric type [Anaerolineae bacterium]HNU03397.1 pyruvate dehydrogenase (acetyl-transferring), homodimeric type [Anaerolineae bacterium]